MSRYLDTLQKTKPSDEYLADLLIDRLGSSGRSAHDRSGIVQLMGQLMESYAEDDLANVIRWASSCEDDFWRTRLSETRSLHRSFECSLPEMLRQFREDRSFPGWRPPNPEGRRYVDTLQSITPSEPAREPASTSGILRWR